MGIANPTSALTGPAGGDVDTERALHYAVVKTAAYAALVGQFRHHFGDRELPEALATADAAAFNDAAMVCEMAESESGNALYDLVAVTRVAFESGIAHADGDCVFCDDRADFDELAELAIAHATSMANAAVA